MATRNNSGAFCGNCFFWDGKHCFVEQFQHKFSSKFRHSFLAIFNGGTIISENFASVPAIGVRVLRHSAHRSAIVATPGRFDDARHGRNGGGKLSLLLLLLLLWNTFSGVFLQFEG